MRHVVSTSSLRNDPAQTIIVCECVCVFVQMSVLLLVGNQLLTLQSLTVVQLNVKRFSASYDRHCNDECFIHFIYIPWFDAPHFWVGWKKTPCHACFTKYTAAALMGRIDLRSDARNNKCQHTYWLYTNTLRPSEVTDGRIAGE